MLADVVVDLLHGHSINAIGDLFNGLHIAIRCKIDQFLGYGAQRWAILGILESLHKRIEKQPLFLTAAWIA